MWVHRISEEPACTSVECYWRKYKLAKVGSSIKFITAKEMSNGGPALASNDAVLRKFLEEGAGRKITDVELVKYQPNYIASPMEEMGMHLLVLKQKEICCENFIKNVVINDKLIKEIEEATRDQSQNALWHELRYGRITASRAYEVSRCKTVDGSLVASIMGGKTIDTAAMKRGRILEAEVRKTVSSMLGKKIKNCGLLLVKGYPMLAGSPDGIYKDTIVEIKCPISATTAKNYIKNGKPTNKYYAQVQMQMFLTGFKKGIFCVADADYSTNKKVEIINVDFDEDYIRDLLEYLVKFWKANVYPLLYKSIK